MSDRRLAIRGGQRTLVFMQQRFFPAGTYTWEVPTGCTEVDVFLVGGGGGAFDLSAGGGGFTKTFKKDTSGWRDGDAITVVPGQSIQIIVGSGGLSVMSTTYNDYTGKGNSGGYSQFMNSNYRANGGGYGEVTVPRSFIGGNGGSKGAALYDSPGTDGTPGQGHTTRDFGESAGKRNAGGGGTTRANNGQGGISDYAEGSGTDCYSPNESGHNNGRAYGGGGYGGGAAAGVVSSEGGTSNITVGGDGTVLIRYYGYR